MEQNATANAGVAFLGNYLPRKCGIATFTTDLCEAVAAAAPGTECFAVAMNDRTEGYAYPPRVRFEVEAARREQYDLAADCINVSQADVVCVQHEYGIFGGRAGAHLLPMLRQLRMPIVTTLHTVLTRPSPEEREVLNELGALSDRLIVMSPRAEQYLKEIYRVPANRIRLIHHGIPDVPFVDPNYYKDEMDAAGRHVLLTFGLMSPGKGIEYMIQALPAVVARHPEVLYIVLGATHPHVRRDQGERYRMQLEQRVRELGLEPHVRFVNRFVSLQELCEYLGAADVYITPYLNEAQITSGTLAYALGAGKAVVSTPYWYAQDMLAEERGRLVPFRDSAAVAETLNDLLTNETARHAMRKRAYAFGRSMIWPAVAAQYLQVFEEVRSERSRLPRPVTTGRAPKTRFGTLPELDPKHLLALTDSVGIFQHAKFTVPDPSHGYSTDDQARALAVAVRGSVIQPTVADWEFLTSRYLSFLLFAFDTETSRFGNFMTYQRQWTKPVATDDVHARALWGLAHVVAYSPNEGHRGLAMQLLEQAVPPTTSFTSPRAWANTILAIQLYLQRYGGASTFRRERHDLAARLLDLYEKNAADDWPWPEHRLTYANARIPHALIEAGQWLPNSRMCEWGLRSLDWLDRVQTAEPGHFVPVGTNGWFERGREKARFDQQPIEAYTMLDACFAAYRMTRDDRWLRSAQKAFDWFLGRNDLQASLHDYHSGGCFDGLHPDRVNRNQGAESTVVWQLSVILMNDLHELLNLKPKPDRGPETSS
ncbi:MAG: glycosyltransferase family 4 protein [Kiritimatiellae bacterium]|nr:glycosyltransferase family 4 protein [Kiritimatiellia bacterium]